MKYKNPLLLKGTRAFNFCSNNPSRKIIGRLGRRKNSRTFREEKAKK
jgi:hypothetical protein